MNHEKINDEIITLLSEVEEGNTDALKAFISLKNVEKVLSEAITQLKESAVTEAKKHGAKQFEFFGAKIQVKDGSARWDYKHIPQWNEFEEKKKQIEEVAKNRYKNPSLIIADENGEEIPMAQCFYDKENISVTICNLNTTSY